MDEPFVSYFRVFRGSSHFEWPKALTKFPGLPRRFSDSTGSPLAWRLTLRIVWAGMVCAGLLRSLSAQDTPVAVEQTVSQGITATDRDFWSFRRLARPVVPGLNNANAAATPIDRFLLARLEAQGLGFSPTADRATLIRRVSFDLIGLPPSLEEVQAFVADDRPDAYALLI
jgi:hypothetical protein